MIANWYMLCGGYVEDLRVGNTNTERRMMGKKDTVNRFSDRLHKLTKKLNVNNRIFIDGIEHACNKSYI